MSNRSERIANLSTTKLALLAGQTYSQVEDILTAEPIAVIGIGCRFPGGGDSPQTFWDMLTNKVCAMSEVPADRWDIDDYYAEDFATPGKMNNRMGGFLKNIDQFDPEFFDIPKREAAQMDPQQRMALEVAFEALDDAGLSHNAIRGSQAGVFISSIHNDYSHLVYANLDRIDLRTLTGTLHSITSNRISYLLDLRGPSITVDTACSSSLVAVHLACQSLRTRDSDLCLAGGVSALISPGVNVALSKVGFASPSGHCYTFDAQADGFVRGEGCGVIVLKRLADAIRSNDRILAVIRGTAVNQDGRSTVLTAPNGQAQQAVIRQAIKNAGLIPSQISHFEAHGTGTHLGDPLEVESLAQVVGPKIDDDHICFLTSVKANIGHLEAGAGIAGVIKVILSLQHEAIPAHPTFEQLNPNISLENTPFVIPTSQTPWPRGERPRYAGVSSYGVGGTNAHVIIGEVPQLAKEDPGSLAKRSFFLPLSARSPQALIERVQSMHAYLQNPALAASLYDICNTATLRRTHFEYRIGIAGNSPDQIAKRLDVLLQDRARLDDLVSRETSEQPPRLAFVFSGQGTQWARMGLNLIEQEPVFREVIQQCDTILRPMAGWSLLEKLSASENESDLDQTEIAQPTIFAIQMGLVALWRSWGVTPDAVVGHSLGEIAAACSAGILTLEEAVFLVYHRGRLMQHATGAGKMVSVDLPRDEVERVIAPFAEEISIGAINSPNATVISGTQTAVDAVLAVLQPRGVGIHPLRVNYAFHSPQMEPYARELSSILANWRGQPEKIAFISTVTGQKMDGAGLDGSYWGKNIRQTVRFADAVQHLTQNGVTLFLEISPHPALSSMIEQAAGTDKKISAIRAVHSLKRNQPEYESLLDSIGKMFQSGVSIDWKAFFPVQGQVIDLPPYPWQHKRYWLEENNKRLQLPLRNEDDHPLLGTPMHSPVIQGVLYQNRIATNSLAYLADHRVFCKPVIPAAAIIEMGLSAAAAETDRPTVLKDLFISDALMLPESQPRSIQFHLSPEDAGEMTMKVFAMTGESNWTLYTSGKIQMIEPDEKSRSENLEEIRAGCAEHIQGLEYYAQQNQTQGQEGVTFGESFQCIRQIWRKDGEALAELQLNDHLTQEADHYRIHPCLLDSALQPITAALPETVSGSCYLPFNIERLQLLTSIPNHVWSHVKIVSGGTNNSEIVTCDVTVMDDLGEVLVDISGLLLKRTPLAAIRHAFHRQLPEELDTQSESMTGIGDCFYQVAWELSAPAPKMTPHLAGRWILFADHGASTESVSGGLISRIQTAGGDCLAVISAESYSAPLNGYAKINPAQPENYRRLWQDLGPQQGPFHIIHLCSLDQSPLDEINSLVDDSFVSLGSFLNLTQTIMAAKGETQPSILLVTRGAQSPGRKPTAPEQAMIWGMANTLFLEQPDLNCVCLDLDPLSLPAEQVENIFNELKVIYDSNEREDRVAYNQGNRLVARLNHIPPTSPQPPQNPMQLKVSQTGNLDSLSLRPAKRIKPGRGEVEIRVLSAGLNFRDVLKTMGRYPGEIGTDVQLGDECAGMISALGEGVEHLRVGDPIIALASGSFSTYVTTTADLVIPKPNHLSFEEAASIPIPFLTVWLALYHLAHLERGQRVLIHAAAGGVGLAAVQLANRVGAEIFATAGSPEKRNYLLSLGVQHVLDSRSLDFAAEILDQTAGHGVDVVLNSLAGDFIPASLSVLAPNGCFLEIGRTGILSPQEAAQIRPDITYYPIFLGELFTQNPTLIYDMLDKILTAMQLGELSPLPRRAFPITAASDAFRFMARARHIGKIVLTLPGLLTERLTDPAVIFKHDATYLITGGLGGIGQVMLRWMVAKGARSLAIVSRKSGNHLEARQLVGELTAAGALVTIFQADTASIDAMKFVIDEIQTKLPRLRGVFHAAGVVEDGVLFQQDWGRFKDVLAGKAAGAWNLHLLTRHLSLDHFVLFSSIAASLGSSGQSNYAAANAFLGALAATRAGGGLPAISIEWGAWSSTGMTARLGQYDQKNIIRRGLKTITTEEGMEALDLTLHDAPTETLVLPVDWPVYLGNVNKTRNFFKHMVRVSKIAEKTHGAGKAHEAVRSNLFHRLEQTLPSQRRSTLIAHIKQEVIRLVGLAPDVELDPGQPLNSYGLDSLMAVEMRNSLSTSLGKSLPASLLFDYPTGLALADHLLQTIPGLIADSAQPAHVETGKKNSSFAPTSSGAPDSAVDQLSEDEAEAQLMAELAKSKKGKSGV
jgi:acyl transferase domain-containing protein/NAD(P)-dependent dehydrogenase (short-subunit alcohol dehydrogenase family)